jgi:hypothetical protein
MTASDVIYFADIALIEILQLLSEGTVVVTLEVSSFPFFVALLSSFVGAPRVFSADSPSVEKSITLALVT